MRDSLFLPLRKQRSAPRGALAPARAPGLGSAAENQNLYLHPRVSVGSGAKIYIRRFGRDRVKCLDIGNRRTGTHATSTHEKGDESRERHAFTLNDASLP